MASPQPARLQMELDVMTGLFNRVVLCTNANKMVGLFYHPFRMAGGKLEASYTRKITGVGTYFQERQW